MAKSKETNARFKQRERVHSHGVSKKKFMNKEKYKQQYGTKTTGEGFAGQGKSTVVHKYNKMLRKDQQRNASSLMKTQKIYQDAGQELKFSQERKGKEKVSSFHKEEKQWKKQANEKAKQQQEMQQKEVEKAKALKKYKDNKRLLHKKLSKKNYKGQPNMAAQMEILLTKIEASKS